MNTAIQLYRLPTVISLVGLSRSSIYRLMDDGAFPVPVKLGQRSVAWRSADVHAWIESRQSTQNVEA
ncbi:helix-turn-helix transcriptional regulator [Vogesella fluminis]|uniref:helix-turn-helix transcriptional regulator n=1 Tax=Vogesella fluminis TaxID=1069161 RepID=UPI001671D632|nr:AlpA family transcriptional regulator [Vogesella fluminis]